MEQNKPVVRVTTIEAFRKYIEQSEYDNYEIAEQSVIDNITQEFTGNEYTRIGTAFHSIVETGKPQCTIAAAGERKFLYYGKEQTEPVPVGRTFDIEGHAVTLDTKQCKVALDYRNEHPDAFHEVRTFKDYGDVIVTGCADMIDGTEIRDIKTKYSRINDTDYINSCQWRFYLDLFGADTFHFDLFAFEGYNLEKHGYDVRGLELTRYQPAITCHRYGKMDEDIDNLLRSFWEWAEYRKLTQYFKNYRQWKLQEQ